MAAAHARFSTCIHLLWLRIKKNGITLIDDFSMVFFFCGPGDFPISIGSEINDTLHWLTKVRNFDYRQMHALTHKQRGMSDNCNEKLYTATATYTYTYFSLQNIRNTYCILYFEFVFPLIFVNRLEVSDHLV